MDIGSSRLPYRYEKRCLNFSQCNNKATVLSTAYFIDQRTTELLCCLPCGNKEFNKIQNTENWQRAELITLKTDPAKSKFETAIERNLEINNDSTDKL